MSANLEHLRAAVLQLQRAAEDCGVRISLSLHSDDNLPECFGGFAPEEPIKADGRTLTVYRVCPDAPLIVSVETKHDEAEQDDATCGCCGRRFCPDEDTLTAPPRADDEGQCGFVCRQCEDANERSNENKGDADE